MLSIEKFFGVVVKSLIHTCWMQPEWEGHPPPKKLLGIVRRGERMNCSGLVNFSSHLWHQRPSDPRTCDPCWPVDLTYYVSYIYCITASLPAILKLALSFNFRRLRDQQRFIFMDWFARAQHRFRHSNTSWPQVAETCRDYHAVWGWYCMICNPYSHASLISNIPPRST